MENEANLNNEINNNNINIIEDKLTNNEQIKSYKNIVIETLIRIFLFQEKIKQLCSNQNYKNNNVGGVIVQKNLIEKYKEVFLFKELKKFLESNPTVLNCIKDNNNIDFNKINKMNISTIIKQINKDLIYKIEDRLNNNLLNGMQKEFKWNYKYIELDDSKIKKILVDFEIIDYEIYSLLSDQNIGTNNFSFADYFINGNNILIIIKNFGYDDVYFEIGEYNNDKGINIEYILDNTKIDDSCEFKQVLINNGIADIFKQININKYINLIEYNEFKINCYKIDNSKMKNLMEKKINNTNNEEDGKNSISKDIKNEKGNISDYDYIIKNDKKKKI